MQVGDLVLDLFGDEVGIIMEVLGEHAFSVLWDSEEYPVIENEWTIKYLDSLFLEPVKNCP